MSLPYSANRHVQLGALTPPAEGFAGSHATTIRHSPETRCHDGAGAALRAQGARPLARTPATNFSPTPLRVVLWWQLPRALRPSRAWPPSRPSTGRKKRAQAAPLEDLLPTGARQLRGYPRPRGYPRASFGRALTRKTRPMAPEGRPRVGPPGPTAPAHGTAPAVAPRVRALARDAPCRALPMPSRTAPGRRSREGIRDMGSGPRGPRAAPLPPSLPDARCGPLAPAAALPQPRHARDA